MSVYIGDALLTRDINEDIKAQEEWAQKEAASRSKWGSIGGTVGGLLPLALALVPGIGQMALLSSVAGSAILGGATSGLGTWLGNRHGDKAVKDIKTKFRQGDLDTMRTSMDDLDTSRIINNVGTAMATQIAAGGIQGIMPKVPTVDPGVITPEIAAEVGDLGLETMPVYQDPSFLPGGGGVQPNYSSGGLLDFTNY